MNFHFVTFIMIKYTCYMKVFMNFHLKVYIQPEMTVKMGNYKFEVKRVTHLKAIDTIVLLLLSDAIFGYKY